MRYMKIRSCSGVEQVKNGNDSDSLRPKAERSQAAFSTCADERINCGMNILTAKAANSHMQPKCPNLCLSDQFEIDYTDPHRTANKLEYSWTQRCSRKPRPSKVNCSIFRSFECSQDRRIQLSLRHAGIRTIQAIASFGLFLRFPVTGLKRPTAQAVLILGTRFHSPSRSMSGLKITSKWSRPQVVRWCRSGRQASRERACRC